MDHLTWCLSKTECDPNMSWLCSTIGWHHWSPTDYVQKGSCKLQAVCDRCGVARPRGVWHEWAGFKENCYRGLRCLRCNEKRSVLPEHEWVFVAHEDCGHCIAGYYGNDPHGVAVCSACKGIGSFGKYRCSDCQAEETR
jgi:hypothetical protein